jgi:hypothetical protein
VYPLRQELGYLMLISVTSFRRPYGESVTTQVEIPQNDEVTWTKYTAIRQAGCRLTAELLRTGEVSICIENPAYGDFRIELFKQVSEEQNLHKMGELINKFDQEEYDAWLATAIQAEEPDDRF